MIRRSLLTIDQWELVSFALDLADLTVFVTTVDTLALIVDQMLVLLWPGQGLFAIFIFFLIFVVLVIVGVFVEKLRGALIGAGLCMLVTVTLFVAFAPRGPKYVADQVEAEGTEYNRLGSFLFRLTALLEKGDLVALDANHFLIV